MPMHDLSLGGLWQRALNCAPWVMQAVAIISFGLALCSRPVVLALLVVMLGVHTFTAAWLCWFLWPHRVVSCGGSGHTAQSHESEDVAPGISIIKPLSGTNDTLLENLESCFELAYPRFELLFCVHGPDDEAVPVVQQLMARHPKVDAQLLFGNADELEGASPKVRNVAKGYEHAKYDVIWSMDAKIRTCAADAHAMVAKLLQHPSVGLVHQLPWARAGVDTSGTLERMFFAGSHARSYCLINGIGLPCTNGMSIMCKRSSWNAIGGCKALATTVAEDSLIGILMQSKGYSCAMAAVPCVQNPPPVPIRSIIERRARWYQLRVFEMDGGRWVAPFELWLEHAALLCLVAAYLRSISATLACAALCATIDTWYARRIDVATRARLGASKLGIFTILTYPALWLLNLLLPFAVMCKGLSSATIVWNCNGTLKPMHPRPYSEKPVETGVCNVLHWAGQRQCCQAPKA